MCTEKYLYKKLTRYALDVFSAIAFVFAYVAAFQASPYYLLWLAILLTLSAFWIFSLAKEYPGLIRWKFLTYTHVCAVTALVLALFIRLLSSASFAETYDRWIISGVVLGFLVYSFGVSLYTYFTDLDLLERGLLPIIPFYALFDAFKKVFQASKKAFQLHARVG